MVDFYSEIRSSIDIIIESLEIQWICMVCKMFIITDWHYIKRKKKIMHK